MSGTLAIIPDPTCFTIGWRTSVGPSKIPKAHRPYSSFKILSGQRSVEMRFFILQSPRIDTCRSPAVLPPKSTEPKRREWFRSECSATSTNHAGMTPSAFFYLELRTYQSGATPPHPFQKTRRRKPQSNRRYIPQIRNSPQNPRPDNAEDRPIFKYT